MLNTICWLWLAGKFSAPTWIIYFLVFDLILDIIACIVKAVS